MAWRGQVDLSLRQVLQHLPAHQGTQTLTIAMDQGCVVTKEVVISLDDDPR